jgi:hypothetical protein
MHFSFLPLSDCKIEHEYNLVNSGAHKAKQETATVE